MTANLAKKAFTALLLCASMLPATNLRAQDVDYTPLSGDFDFLAVRITKLCTTDVLDHGNFIKWTGNGMHAGMQQLGFNLFNCKPVQKNITLPDDPKFICIIKDMDGNVVASHEYSLGDTFRAIRFSKK